MEFYCNLYSFFCSKANWSDFIWPTIITISTIMASVCLARGEFLKNQKAEKRKIESERKELKNFILRNIKRVIDQLTIDGPRFKKVYVDNYSIKEGIAPQHLLFSFKELEILNAIDAIRWESVFKIESKAERGFDQLYLTFSAISIIWDSYKKISDEVSDINSFLKDYDTILLEKHQNIVFFVDRIILEYAEKNKDDESINYVTFKSLFDILNSYKSKLNNFSELHSTIINLDESIFFKKIVDQHFFEFNERTSQFLIYYLKYEQEVFLFHSRILHLIARIEVNRIHLQNFYSNLSGKAP